jgi:hypothetical protein
MDVDDGRRDRIGFHGWNMILKDIPSGLTGAIMLNKTLGTPRS